MNKFKSQLHLTPEKNIIIRNLTSNDINQIAKARICQEIENGNGASSIYIENYKKVLTQLFNNNKLIATGAFKEAELISLAFFNLLHYGKKQLLPYLCGVWTKPSERGKGISSLVNSHLLKETQKLRFIFTAICYA